MSISDNLGLGVMINILGGNESTVEALKKSIGKGIAEVVLEGDDLIILFEDGAKLRTYDNGQSCCETRYMRTDDDLTCYAGSALLGMETADAPGVEDEHGEPHDVQFLNVKTSKGVFTMSSHNEHNGYYGGFSIVCSYIEPEPEFEAPAIEEK